MATVNVNILDMEKELFKGACDIAIFPGKEGELAVLPGHTRLVTPLRKGKIVLKTAKTEKTFAIERGFLYVDKKDVKVLVG
ncbi:MAG: hypothetical protein JW938_02655 [Candidatus Omnitrophica bacterium]|nr:hypothetical protein [Candidatus Omnitrophota bacterium]